MPHLSIYSNISNEPHGNHNSNRRPNSIVHMTDKPRLKAVLLGDSGVGKTTIFNNLVAQASGKELIVNDTQYPTIGLDYSCLYYTDNQYVEHTIQLWDTSGQERFANSLVKSYTRGTNIYLLVFSWTDAESYLNIWKKWIPLIESEQMIESKLFLIATKEDELDRNPAISTTSPFLYVHQNIKEYNISYFFSVKAQSRKIPYTSMFEFMVNYYNRSQMENVTRTIVLAPKPFVVSPLASKETEEVNEEGMIDRKMSSSSVCTC